MTQIIYKIWNKPFIIMHKGYYNKSLLTLLIFFNEVFWSVALYPTEI